MAFDVVVILHIDWDDDHQSICSVEDSKLAYADVGDREVTLSDGFGG